jgi:hypothetical protein
MVISEGEGTTMEQLLSRCGYRCDLCLAYRPNVEAHPENPQILSDGWDEYYGFRIPPEDILCDGCLADQPRLIDRECPVRPCVLERGLPNCSQCGEYVCDKLAQRIVVFERIAERVAGPIPDADRERFISPYENRRRLDALRPQPR